MTITKDLPQVVGNLNILLILHSLDWLIVNCMNVKFCIRDKLRNLRVSRLRKYWVYSVRNLHHHLCLTIHLTHLEMMLVDHPVMDLPTRNIVSRYLALVCMKVKFV